MKFKKSKKIFIHVDCDSFFAECEILKNPNLKNKYVLVGKEIVTACNYKCKKLGIKSAMPVWQAEKILWDKWIFLDIDHNYYSKISDKLMFFLRQNTLNIEPFSIDEAFCEITGLPELYNTSLEEYVKKLQKSLIDYIWVPVSIWVSNTRIKAKIFSKLNKPKWIYIDLWNSKELFKKLPLSIVPFIWKSKQEFFKYSCKNIYDFITLWFFYLKKNIWKTATDLWLELSWVNAFVVRKNPDSKSMSRARSFNKNITNNKDFLYRQLLQNFNYLFLEFSEKQYSCKKISIFFRDKQKQTHIYSYDFKKEVFERFILLEKLRLLFDQNYNKNMFCRTTWVEFSKLKKNLESQLNIFENINKSKEVNKQLFYIINNLNHKYNSNKISFWTELLGKWFNNKLGIRR